ncbi:MAG: hypothetical protein CVU42_10995 [Chloroflexi bacterium HGW-Chloroflexi-4]|jgi:hypothetical protein|nr:MAG: hypothetical protein CVU42_10995 [Chloroflexi bacterium HGW-Chloroflexi-4]
MPAWEEKMEKQNSILLGITLVIIIALSACTAPPAAQPTAQATAIPEIVATEAATEAVAAVEPTATTAPTATLEPTATVAVEPTATAETAAAAPTTEMVNAAGNVVISLAKNTICRTGPATNYPSVASIPAGQQVNAVGKLENSTSYTYIENPSAPGSFCWVFSEGAAIQGDPKDLKIVKPIASPTPDTKTNFSLTFSGIQQCTGGDYSFNVVVANTNEQIWQSISMYIVDANTKKSASYSSDHFEGWSDCHVDWYQDDLTEGEHAFISPFDPGHFDYNPAGGTFFIRVKLCSEDGLTGTCMNKEIKVKP